MTAVYSDATPTGTTLGFVEGQPFPLHPVTNGTLTQLRPGEVVFSPGQEHGGSAEIAFKVPMSDTTAIAGNEPTATLNRRQTCEGGIYVATGAPAAKAHRERQACTTGVFESPVPTCASGPEVSQLYCRNSGEPAFLDDVITAIWNFCNYLQYIPLQSGQPFQQNYLLSMEGTAEDPRHVYMEGKLQILPTTIQMY